ncbi:MAG: bifunctional UDP-N-acetylglucosamine diphosphorylase/glucosamine-1-phosphate N-acetyltransferase GlmU [Brachymonas sp.]
MTSSSNLHIVVMAAGKGTRMKSAHSKVLQKLAGKGLLLHVLATAQALQAKQTVLITGHQAESVEAAASSALQGAAMQLQFARQEQQLGTGHAVQQALPHLPDTGVALILSGDVPLTQATTLQALLAAAGDDKLALLTIHLPDPTGYGRIVRQGDAVQAIVEQKDASVAQQQITEIYSGIMALPCAKLKQWLAKLDNKNAQGEYYLTDVVKFAVEQSTPVVAHVISDEAEVAGVNSPQQLAALERQYQSRQAEKLMTAGVRLADPARIDVRGVLTCGQDVDIDINCIFSGKVEIGSGVRIGAGCVLSDCRIDDGVELKPYTVIEGEKLGASVGAGSILGPFARLRPGAQLAQEVHIGNFVEVKNSTMAKGSKANHLAYLGDATVGERVNYGAGSITANYDGANKHRTVLGADVHIGSNCVLVAPVEIGAGSTVGGGSTISKDVPAQSLAVARGKQVVKAGWQRPAKQKT